MAFLDKAKGKISKASYSTMQKAKDMSELTKLHMAVSESETKIKEYYSEIGYKIYCSYRENPLPEVVDEIEQITELHQAIEACSLQIKVINMINTCPKCGSRIKPDMTFCSRCGFKLISGEKEKEEKTGKENPIFCSECGTLLEPGTIFCTECGNKIGV